MTNLTRAERVVEWCSRQAFAAIHGNNLVYNACWEDPQLDREALDLKPTDTLLTITSAGCNVLDFALAGTGRIHAVDINPRQNALLELKMAGIRALDFETFFALFGRGRLADFSEVYRQRLRPLLSTSAAAHWDRRQDYFSANLRRSGFYFRGSAGFFARWMNRYIDHARLRDTLHASFEAESLAEQEYLYRSVLHGKFWKAPLRAMMKCDLPLAFLGVPRAQRRQVEEEVDGGIYGFLQNAIETVFTRLPLKNNYFWWLYVNGAYTRERCPEYLKRENFQALKDGLVDSICVHTGSLVDFMAAQRERGEKISRFVLLDHMDWLQGSLRPVLEREWQMILETASQDALLLWRSASPRRTFVDEVPVQRRGKSYRVKDSLVYHDELAQGLAARDRVHTYASLSIASVAPGWVC